MLRITGFVAGLVALAGVASAQDLPDLQGRAVTAMIDERLPGQTSYEKGERSSLEHAALDEIARRLNLKVEWLRTDTETMVPTLVGGAGDIAIDRAPVDAPRGRPVVFTEPYLELDLVILARADLAGIDPADPDLTVGAVSGESAKAAVANLLANDPNSSRLVTYERDSEAAAAVLHGNVDVAVVDNLTAEIWIAKAGGEIAQIGKPIGSESFAFVLAEGADLVDALDAGLQSLREDGTLRAYTLKWMNDWD